MIDEEFDQPRVIVDQYDNQHRLVTELARGGQGVVFRTADSDLAVKVPFGDFIDDEDRVDMALRYQRIRSLPIPHEISVALPLAVLRDEVGYVMHLLNEMESFHSCFESIEGGDESSLLTLPSWLDGLDDTSAAVRLLNYAKTGSTKRRLHALAEIASVLSQLHSLGMVYGDLSPNNCFVGPGERPKVALIDADNLRYEQLQGGTTVYTPGYAASEIIQGRDCSRPRTDVWSFAVLAFDSLTLQHPFKGILCEEMEVEEPGWDSIRHASDSRQGSIEHALNGGLPYIDDLGDASNRSAGGIDRELVFTPELAMLFQAALGAGRLEPWRRPSMTFFAREMFRAHDTSIVCPECSMSYFVGSVSCPFCECAPPRHVLLSTNRWALVWQDVDRAFEIPNRLIQPFAPRSANETICEAVVDFEAEFITHARGSTRLPQGISARFQR